MHNIAHQFVLDDKIIWKLKFNKVKMRENSKSRSSYPWIHILCISWYVTGIRKEIIWVNWSWSLYRLHWLPKLFVIKIKLLTLLHKYQSKKNNASWRWFAKFQHQHKLNSINIFFDKVKKWKKWSWNYQSSWRVGFWYWSVWLILRT